MVEVVRALSDRVMDSFRLMDLPIAEQVVEVPKVSSSSCPSRAFLREPQMAEQLVEVPTVLSPALLQQQVEQIVDNPAPRGRGARGGLPSFFPGQDLQRSVDHIVDIPVPGRGAPSGRQGSHTRQSSSQRTVEQTPDIPFPVVVVVTWVSPGTGFNDGFLGLNMSMELFKVHDQDRVRSRFLGHSMDTELFTVHAELGGSVGGPHGSVPRQGSTARGRADHRRFVGRLFILADSRGCGFIESSAEAEFGESASGGFRGPVSWQGHFAVDSTVTFSVWKGPAGFT